MYGVRFRRKDLREFEPSLYVTGTLTYDDVLDLKEVFNAYDSTGMGVLLPNDMKLAADPERVYTQQKNHLRDRGRVRYRVDWRHQFSIEFIKAMDTQPYRNEDKKLIASIFKKYDRDNKNYLTIEDLKDMKNNHVKENLDT